MFHGSNWTISTTLSSENKWAHCPTQSHGQQQWGKVLTRHFTLHQLLNSQYCKKKRLKIDQFITEKRGETAAFSSASSFQRWEKKVQQFVAIVCHYNTTLWQFALCLLRTNISLLHRSALITSLYLEFSILSDHCTVPHSIAVPLINYSLYMLKNVAYCFKNQQNGCWKILAWKWSKSKWVDFHRDCHKQLGFDAHCQLIKSMWTPLSIKLCVLLGLFWQQFGEGPFSFILTMNRCTKPSE